MSLVLAMGSPDLEEAYRLFMWEPVRPDPPMRRPLSQADLEDGMLAETYLQRPLSFDDIREGSRCTDTPPLTPLSFDDLQLGAGCAASRSSATPKGSPTSQDGREP